MRTSRWGISGGTHSSAQLILSPAAAQLLASPSVPGGGVAHGIIIQPAVRLVVITTVVPLVSVSAGIRPSAAQLLFTTTTLAPTSPWTIDFSNDFGPISFLSQGKTIIIPPIDSLLLSFTSPVVASVKKTIVPAAGQLLSTTTAPIAFKRAPAAQLLTTRSAPQVGVGRFALPARRDVLFTATAPRILPGKQIIPGSKDLLFTGASPTVTAGAPTFSVPAWNAHTFAVGEQCGVFNRAFQCTTSGQSTIPPTNTGFRAGYSIGFGPMNVAGTIFHMGNDGAFFVYIGVAA